MAENKTKPEAASVGEFLDSIQPPERQADAHAVCALMEDLSGERPQMWGSAIVGFGSYHYKYDSGREGDSPRIGFSPRKAALTLYVLDGIPQQAELLAALGKHKTGKSCLYVKSLEDVNMAVLGELVEASLAHMDARYPREK